MFKIFKFTLFLCLGMLMSWSATAQDDCDCEFGNDDEFICVATPDGEIVPLPNLCFAECLGFTADAIVECEDWDDGDWEDPFEDCDCEFGDENEFVCVTDEHGEIIPFPNACFAECLGYGADAIVECDDWNGGDWEDPFEDCDCDFDWENEEWICVATAEGDTIPFPSACFAECAGYGADAIVDCPVWDGGDWEDPFEGCDCEFDFIYVCVATEEGDTISFPNACLAECAGYGEEAIVECPEWLDCGDEEWEDPFENCDCEFDFEDEWVCVEVEGGDIISFPSACFAECEGYSAEAIVACDDWHDGEWETCDCEFGEEDEWVCVELEEDIIISFPNACFAACEGYGAETIVECEEWEDPFEDCDCEFGEEDEWVCVTIEGGQIVPFPNACFAACLGYGADAVVECEDWDGGEWDNECECTEEYAPVCVDLDGELVEFPNACIAICFGIEEGDLVECDGFNNDDDSNLETEPYISISLNPVQKVSLAPNPTSGRMTVDFTIDTDVNQVNVQILSLQGQVLQTQSLSAVAGHNQVAISATDLPAGIYLVQLSSASFQETIKFVKR